MSPPYDRSFAILRAVGTPEEMADRHVALHAPESHRVDVFVELFDAKPALVLLFFAQLLADFGRGGRGETWR